MKFLAGIEKPSVAERDRVTIDETLRLMAKLPAPEGLTERIRANVRIALREEATSGKLLAWPKGKHNEAAASLNWRREPSLNWLRGLAAAALVCAVVGGGWGILARVQQFAPAGKAMVPPAQGIGGGFSNAGAMRLPQTLNGPLVSPVKPVQKPVIAETNKVAEAQKRSGKSAQVKRNAAQKNSPTE